MSTTLHTYMPFSKAAITHRLDRLWLLNSHLNFSFLTFKVVGEGVDSDGEHIQWQMTMEELVSPKESFSHITFLCTMCL